MNTFKLEITDAEYIIRLEKSEVSISKIFKLVQNLKEELCFDTQESLRISKQIAMNEDFRSRLNDMSSWEADRLDDK